MNVCNNPNFIHRLASDSSSYEKDESAESVHRKANSIERNPSLLVCPEWCKLTHRIKCRGVIREIKLPQVNHYPLIR